MNNSSRRTGGGILPTFTFLGSGSWGSAFGKAVSGAGRVVYWDRTPAVAVAAARDTAAAAERDFATAVAGADLIIVAVSSGGFADTLSRVAALPNTAPVVWLTKGFAADGARPLSAVAAGIFAKNRTFAAISGPSFADEVRAGLPTALAIAANRKSGRILIQKLLHQPTLRLYPEDDLTGVCVGGATKNIIAIAAGISDAMQLGSNARAALITRGLSEIIAVNRALGGKQKTLMGLAGIGDLVLSCSSDLSRNRRLGLATGATPEKIYAAADIAALTPGTCEGQAAALTLSAYTREHGIDAPIVGAVAAVLGGKLSPAEALRRLLARTVKLS